MYAIRSYYVEKKRDVIELPINDLLDINGWDIKKTLSLYQKSNPTLLEWFSSPIVYREQTDFTDRLKKLLDIYFSVITSYSIHYTKLYDSWTSWALTISASTTGT